MKFLILTRYGDGSPKILANSLKNQLEIFGNKVVINTHIDLLTRLVPFKSSGSTFQFWAGKRIANFLSDRRLINVFRTYDAVIISDCCPNGFWKSLYNVEKLKTILQKPVFFYEVYYLGNAPTQLLALQKNKEPLLERYDAHLFVSPVTEIRQLDSTNAFCIGLLAKTWSLKPLPKKEIIALIDFAHPGYEYFRDQQIKALTKVNIKFVKLEQRYTIEEIRTIYQEVSIYFMQSPEAFGLPILECLCAGAQVFTPDSSWPMSWRLNENPEVHGPGLLPSCFTVYDGKNDLEEKLQIFKSQFDLEQSPLTVFDSLLRNYPTFYNGDREEVKKFLESIAAQKQ